MLLVGLRVIIKQPELAKGASAGCAPWPGKMLPWSRQLISVGWVFLTWPSA